MTNFPANFLFSDPLAMMMPGASPKASDEGAWGSEFQVQIIPDTAKAEKNTQLDSSDLSAPVSVYSDITPAPAGSPPQDQPHLYDWGSDKPGPELDFGDYHTHGGQH